MNAAQCKVLVAYLHGRLSIGDTRIALGLSTDVEVHQLVQYGARLGTDIARRAIAEKGQQS